MLQFKESIWLNTSYLQLRLYVFISIGLSCVEFLNSLSMTILPGSLYALLKGSDIGWSMVLSRFILRKRFAPLQVFGAGLVVMGVTLVFALQHTNRVKSNETKSDHRLESSSVSIPFAAGLCLFAAFLNALLAVLTEATLKATLKEEQERLLGDKDPSKLLLSNAYSMWTTMFSFVILLGSMAVTKEKGPIIVGDSYCIEESSTTKSHLIAVTFCLILVGLSRFAERLSKHWICVADSAMTFSLVQAGRRMSGVFLLAWLFQEDFGVGMWIGSIVCVIGFAVHSSSSNKNRLYEQIPEQNLEEFSHRAIVVRI